MQINTTAAAQVAAEDLARALLEAPPGEFAAFWTAMAEAIDKRDDGSEVLMAHADAIASAGQKTVRPLRDLVQLVDYHVVARRQGGSK